MPSKASSKHDTIYSHVQYLGCHRMKYNEDAARRTRVYPMIFGIKRNTISWCIRGFGGGDGPPGDILEVVFLTELPFCDGVFGMTC